MRLPYQSQATGFTTPEHPLSPDTLQAFRSNEASIRNLWSDPAFIKVVKGLKKTGRDSLGHYKSDKMIFQPAILTALTKDEDL